jgi:hypothetical protein
MNSGSESYCKLSFVSDGNAEQPLKRLKPGRIVQSIIILRSIENRYLLRLSGCKTVMESRLKINRFEAIDILVKQTKPKLIPGIADNREISNSRGSARHRDMNFLV